VLHIIRDARRIDDADALEGQTLLALQPGDGVSEPERQRVLAAIQEVGGKERGDVRGPHRPVGAALTRGLDLDQRLEPVGAA